MENSGGAGAKILGWPARVKEYFGELQAEMRRVTWPSRKQVRATTVVVIAAMFGFAAYFMVVDVLLGQGVTWVFDSFARK